MHRSNSLDTGAMSCTASVVHDVCTFPLSTWHTMISELAWGLSGVTHLTVDITPRLPNLFPDLFNTCKKQEREPGPGDNRSYICRQFHYATLKSWNEPEDEVIQLSILSS